MTKASDNAFPSILITEGTEPSAPAAGKQRMYIDSTTHVLMLTNSSGTETTVGASASLATDTLWDAAGDLVVGTGANTAAKLSIGTSGKILQSNGTTATWGLNPGRFESRRVASVANTAAQTININSTTYVQIGYTDFYMDFDIFPASHFLITQYGAANAAVNVTMQLAEAATPGTPYSAGGDDLVINNSTTNASSGWIAINSAPSGLKYMTIAMKGANATVDWIGRWIDVAFKIA